jgi:hypothetical protein
VFGNFGAGDHKLQPIYVGDLAQSAVQKVKGGRKPPFSPSVVLLVFGLN